MGFRNSVVAAMYLAVFSAWGCSLRQEGGSEPDLCQEGGQKCDGNWAQICQDGLWSDVELCQTECKSGACVEPEPACEWGQRRCNGDATELCEGDPAEWTMLTQCAQGCEEGECLEDEEPVCTPGERVCDQNQVWECTGEGADWLVAEECAVLCEEGACVGEAVAHLRGSVSYEARLPDSSGEEIFIGAVQTFPLGYVTVVVSDGTQFIGQAVADANGAFDVGLSQPLQGGETLLFVPVVEVGEKAVLLVAKPTAGGEPGTTNPDPWVWSMPLDGATELGSLLIPESSGSGAAYIFDVNRLAMANVLGSQLLPQVGSIQPLAVLWAPGVSWSCGACYAPRPQLFGDQEVPNTIFISDDPDGSSAWGYAVLLHEFGHYVARNYSRDDSPGGPHTVGVPVVPPFAWSEGWATFFAISTFSRFLGEPMPLYWDIQGGGSFWINVASLQFSSTFAITPPDASGSMLQSLDENWVAMMLWDLWDGADMPEVVEEDGSQLGTEAVIAAVTSSRFLNGDRGSEGADFVDFLDAVLCAHPELAGACGVTVNTYLSFPYDGAWTCN